MPQERPNVEAFDDARWSAMKAFIKKLVKKLRLVALRWAGGLLGVAAVVVAWRFVPEATRQSIWDLARPTDVVEFWTTITGLATAVLVALAWSGLRSLGLRKCTPWTQ